jgi:hypothetical protein
MNEGSFMRGHVKYRFQRYGLDDIITTLFLD